jgi:hypothetical protein
MSSKIPTDIDGKDFSRVTPGVHPFSGTNSANVPSPTVGTQNPGASQPTQTSQSAGKGGKRDGGREKPPDSFKLVHEDYYETPAYYIWCFYVMKWMSCGYCCFGCGRW